ncbi:hypothetical protein THOG11_80288 [Vibrio harveyi]|jgi:hypothetical protein|nr:hypothetical protein TH15OA1_80010 [Vibrio harveyi]CAH1546382.1 hypothetical protein VHARVF571_70010 [Vibrio harveyi]CAH1582180.1 hypothetical protein THOD03_70290 [Vibrio harveyi]CAH1590537.1 hypothetical protein THOG11_80288 [Vibrio harveyi]CAK6715774.1 hypothetical protein HORM4_60012 [Vibrio harveyi]
MRLLCDFVIKLIFYGFKTLSELGALVGEKRSSAISFTLSTVILSEISDNQAPTSSSE